MSSNSILRWRGGALVPAETDEGVSTPVLAADSWLVTDGTALVLALHHDRFAAAIRARGYDLPDVDDFWSAAITAIPRTGDWFPRVDVVGHDDTPELVFQLRNAPERNRSVVVQTLATPDPRLFPAIKGPDLERMSHARSSVAPNGAGEAVIVTGEGYVVEGAYSGLLWWRGSILCGPLAEFDRVNSVTTRSVLALAAALGIETYEEAVTPAELEGVELWSLNALHGARMVTRWIDGPSLAELPGRLEKWRTRLAALRQPV